MEIVCITTGRVRPKRRDRGPLRYLPGGWSGRTLPVHAFAIRHPEGLCLFDAGQTSRAAEPGYHQRWHPFLRLARFELGPEDEAAPQLERLGLGVPRWVVLSHLHTDHVGGVAAFPEAEVLVSRTEWERARGFAGRLRGYVPQGWPPELEPVLVDFQGPPLGPFAASHDITGDGSLVLVPTPGHTPGHLSLLVRDDEVRALCAGDLAHSRAELAPEVGRWCEAEGVTVLAAHDPAASTIRPALATR